MNSRKVFHHILAKDLKVGDTAMIEQPGYEQNSVCRCLLTLVKVYARSGEIIVEGKTKNGYLQSVFLEPDQLIAVVSNG